MRDYLIWLFTMVRRRGKKVCREKERKKGILMSMRCRMKLFIIDNEALKHLHIIVKRILRSVDLGLFILTTASRMHA